MSSKRKYLKQKKHEPYRLNVSDYNTLVPYFFGKYQINLPYVINGSTATGRRMMAENYLQLQAEINEYQNEELVYAKQVMDNWSPPGVSLPGKYRLNQKNTKHSDFQKYYPELYAAIKDKFLNKENQFKELSEEEQLQLNTIVKRLKCRKKLDEYRQEKLEALHERKNKICLDKTQAIAEVKSIQNTLAGDETVIYFFTNNRSKGSAHFEVLLVKRDRIIKPVNWFLHESNMFESTDFSKMFVTDLSPFVTFTVNKKTATTLDEDPMKRLQPQVDSDSCGVLGLLYLKELLKNNSEQLQEFSFAVPLYSDANEKGQVFESLLFFPSPHVLRYSQSRLYNSIILAMVQSTNDEEVIQYKNISYTVKTLQGILKESIAIANQKGAPEVAQIENLWVHLPDFREKWLEAYQEMAQKRQEMQGKANNLYLAYKGHRMTEILADNTRNQSSTTMTTTTTPMKLTSHEEDNIIDSATSENTGKVTYNPLYKPLSSTSRVETYKLHSFFKPQGEAMVSYNPLYKSKTEERNELACC